ncbi:MAG: hypothetical protein BWY80_00034 [Firmicutes bacterium ADurb.Bin456]|nr:MAG: hypothetical protein BWY80_00034 [Firmicutes bacterium ADurb.Bin456]
MTRKGVTLPRTFTVICCHCGKPFQASSDRARYCGAACKQAAYRERKSRRAVVTVYTR